MEASNEPVHPKIYEPAGLLSSDLPNWSPGGQGKELSGNIVVNSGYPSPCKRLGLALLKRRVDNRKKGFVFGSSIQIAKPLSEKTGKSLLGCDKRGPHSGSSYRMKLCINGSISRS
ncbi:hypothetical protein AKJ16_DCAP10445 [Drosera capensis]